VKLNPLTFTGRAKPCPQFDVRSEKPSENPREWIFDELQMAGAVGFTGYFEISK
jgi:hypothetical protein